MTPRRISPELSLTMFRDMLRIRMVEEKIAELYYPEQEMRCPVHLSIGQEATAVGACLALDTRDQIVSTHRCHGHYLAKGGDLKAMLAEIYGKAAGCVGGRGGSMHLMDTEAGVFVSLPIVGSAIPIGIGVAFSARRRGEDTVCMVFAGDAAVEEGVFHESANFAALRKLPVVFLLENNFFSVYTPLAERQPLRSLTEVARAHAIPAAEVDGNDVGAVSQAAEEAVARARRGDGPTLIVCTTYRWREHCGPNFDNDLGYRAPEEFEAWRQRCPIVRQRTLLKKNGLLGQAAEDAMTAEIAAEIENAFAFAKEACLPDPRTAGDLVYA